MGEFHETWINWLSDWLIKRIQCVQSQQTIDWNKKRREINQFYSILIDCAQNCCITFVPYIRDVLNFFSKNVLWYRRRHIMAANVIYSVISIKVHLLWPCYSHYRLWCRCFFCSFAGQLLHFHSLHDPLVFCSCLTHLSPVVQQLIDQTSSKNMRCIIYSVPSRLVCTVCTKYTGISSPISSRLRPSIGRNIYLLSSM